MSARGARGARAAGGARGAGRARGAGGARGARGRNQVEPLPGWIAWPIRILAVIFVVPFQLAWEALSFITRLIGRYVLMPIARYVLKPIAEYVLYPVLYYVLWVPLRFIFGTLLWRPLAWLGKHVLAPMFVAFWHGLVWFVKALGPFWRLLGRVLLEAARAVVFVVTLLNRYFFYPLGIAIAWAWNHSVVLLWRYLVVIPFKYLVAIPVAWVWRNVVVPPARWVRRAVLHPIAETTRRVLESLGLR
ncbi:hypothetical protein [Dactylosporangium sp. CA-139066]|uniref:hypothetical protein n=1 Tax=Dactylosporangium sp. CA-139066 TaxID=3239930 RepID=UPI003D915CE1